MSAKHRVTLTGPQLEALRAACAYCLAAGPEEMGLEDDADGARIQRNLQRAHEVLSAVDPGEITEGTPT